MAPKLQQPFLAHQHALCIHQGCFLKAIMSGFSIPLMVFQFIGVFVVKTGAAFAVFLGKPKKNEKTAPVFIAKTPRD
jgi:hypothetical protein